VAAYADTQGRYCSLSCSFASWTVTRSSEKRADRQPGRGPRAEGDARRRRFVPAFTEGQRSLPALAP
jgi:hypothetical protein